MHLELFYNKKNPNNKVSQKFDNYEEDQNSHSNEDNIESL